MLEQSGIAKLHQAYRQGKTSPTKVCRSLLSLAKKENTTLNAFLRLDEEKILAQAKASEQRLAKNKADRVLEGIPIAIKDNIAETGEALSCGSLILDSFNSPYDATVIARLKRAGAILFGRTNMDEFAMGSSNENSAFGPVANPWDQKRVAGGSSGGSAAAVAAGLCPVALGSDTGGSIRQPASLCGVYGFKPTYGRVSRFGLVAFASSLDQIGPFARNAKDCAQIYRAIAGHDPLDSTSADVALDAVETDHFSVKGLKLGVPKEYLSQELNAEVLEAFEHSITALEAKGAKRVEISLPHTFAAISTYYIIANAEASANLARYDGIRYGRRAKGTQDLQDLYRKSRSQGFGQEVKRRIMLGTYVLSSGYYDAYYRKALRVRTLLRNDFSQAFQNCDCIVTPTTPTVAFGLGEKAENPLAMYLSDIYTVSVSLAGLPAISLPAGVNKEKLPIGLQLIGREFCDGQVLQLAAFLEKHHPQPLWGSAR